LPATISSGVRAPSGSPRDNWARSARPRARGLCLEASVEFGRVGEVLCRGKSRARRTTTKEPAMRTHGQQERRLDSRSEVQGPRCGCCIIRQRIVFSLRWTPTPQEL
jgi:hypothetical protein